MSSGLELRWLDGDRRPLEYEVARLHGSLLPHSPLARLGQRYLSHYYYRVLPRLELVDVLVAVVDGRAVGFIAVTADADQFMNRALRATPFALAWALACALFADPRRIRVLFEARAIARVRSADAAGGGELLTFAVEESVRNARFVRARGIRVANQLLNHAVDRLRARGVRRIRSLVDADNHPVRILYGAMGWRLNATSVGGWRMPQVEFVHEPSDPA